VTADDGTRIYYELFSPEPDLAREGAAPVLLLMGLGGNGRLWGPAVRRLLGDGHDVIAVDNRGCGRSGTPWLPFTTSTMAADAVAVLDQLGIERAHIGGASFGGMIAQEIALEFPERVGALVLLCTTGGLPRMDLSLLPRLDLVPRRGILPIFGTVLRSFRPASDPEQRVRDFLSMAASQDYVANCRPEDEAWAAVAASLEVPSSQRGLVMQVLAAAGHSSWSRLSRLRMPVLVHHGTEDRIVPIAAGEELARRIPTARFEAYEGAGHGIFERLDESSGSILAFLGECDPLVA
jgi:pimeloyl-ACP methyl ester carboxylesterase